MSVTVQLQNGEPVMVFTSDKTTTPDELIVAYKRSISLAAYRVYRIIDLRFARDAVALANKLNAEVKSAIFEPIVPEMRICYVCNLIDLKSVQANNVLCFDRIDTAVNHARQTIVEFLGV